ncbi:MAG: 3-hydroxyacyl-CoA dehydrogenase family protein [bacterium]
MIELDKLKIGIIGAGTMGAGIAQSFAECGYEVIWYNRSERGIQRGLNLIKLNQETLIKNEVLTKDKAEKAIKRIKLTLNLDELNDVDFVSESIAENIEIKQDIFSKINGICSKDAILTTNTSGLSITKISSVISNPERFVGMHWWNPPHIIPLVEVIKGDNSSEETCMIVMEICRRLGKKPVYVKKDVPGFIGNRMQMALQREVMYMVDSGIADPEDIDTVMKYGPGARWALYGPCEIADLAGLDIVRFVCGYLFKELCNREDVPKVLDEKVSNGELGTKTGKGFYQYTDDKIKKILESRDKRLLKIFRLQSED